MQHTLRDRRLALKMTQEQMAHALGVSLRTWQNWEQSRRLPRHTAMLERSLHDYEREYGEEIMAKGPAAQRRFTPKEVGEIHAGKWYPSYFRTIDGAWTEYSVIRALPPGSHYYATEQDGIWWERRKTEKGADMPTGKRAPFPPYRPWDGAFSQ